jgi:hypothetical protein
MITMLVHKTIVAHHLDVYMKIFLTNVGPLISVRKLLAMKKKDAY